ncbi:hypothetical protein [Chryseobacterium sp. HMWF035]|uniref:hypothetical protein n=1 Tax=Chryseobacterium sp. HMWF035 TaxID=2056868 RepID=UPI0018867F11|nr:hypothetical protein [Chryseobacterium sp. HMWF035]
MEICKCDLLKKSEDSINAFYAKHKFKTISKKEALKPKYDYISVKYLKNYSKSQDIVDSLELKISNEISKIVPDTAYVSYKIRDSIERLEYSKKFGDIPKPVIIKTGKLHGAIAVLYQTRNVYHPKYYLRISYDEGKSWKNYYTGLEKSANYLFKTNSKYPLWKNKNSIQIEADIVRMIKEPLFPSSPLPTYETIENNALITLNLKEIIKDSDDDGINDLEEKFVYFTNPLSADTDKDGIMDFDDENPRYKSLNNDFTKLVEILRFGDYPLLTNNSTVRMDEFITDLKTVHDDIQTQIEKQKSEFKPREKSLLDLLEFKVIVTNDENIRRMDTYGEKTIFLTSKEYSNYLKYNYGINYCNYRKIFKCDDKKDTYILTFDSLIIGETYIFIKITEGWIVRIGNRWQA